MCVCVSQGELAISSEMEQIQTALFFDNVPDTWTRLAYPSTYSLALWSVHVCGCASIEWTVHIVRLDSPKLCEWSLFVCVCVC